MAIMIVCDRTGCPSQRRETDNLDGWLVVHGLEDDGEHRQFCSADCMIQAYAAFEVPETMPSE